MTSPVVITGIGVVSTLGLSYAELARSFATGRQAAASAELAGRGSLVGEIPVAVLPEKSRARLGRLDRLCRMLLGASHLAWRSAGLDMQAEASDRIGLSFGTALGCLLTNEEYFAKVIEGGPGAASPRLFAYTVSSAAAGEVSIALGIKGPNVTSHMGFAAGLGAVGYGFDLIRMGKADVVIAAGADVIGPALVEALADMKLLKRQDASRPFLDSVPGVFPSEGAAVVVLESLEHAHRRGAKALAYVDGYAAGFEPTLTRPHRRSTGIATTLRRAVEHSRRLPGGMALFVSSAHGTPLDAVERAALAEAHAEQRSGVIFAPKQMLGETFGAAGALGVALTVGFWEAQPTWTAEVGFDLNGEPLDTRETTLRLRRASVAMLCSVCYSGSVVGLVLSRELP